MNPIVVKPRWTAWAAIPLFIPVGFYAAMIGCGIVLGMPENGDARAPEFWRTVILVGTLFASGLVLQSVRLLRSRGYWRLDERGVRLGRGDAHCFAWTDIEACVVGLPPAESWFFRLLSKVPTTAVQNSLALIQSQRSKATVLKLKGRRLLALNLATKSHGETGAAFMAALHDRCAPVVGWEACSRAELSALEWIRFGRVVELSQ